MTAAGSSMGKESQDETAKQKLVEEEIALEERKKKLNQEKLYLIQMNQKRRYIVVGTSLAFALIWAGFAVLQSEILNLKAEETLYYGNVLETTALVFCIASLICSIALIHIYNKQRKKEKELQALSKENKEEIQDNKLEKSAVYLDAFASLVIVITELAVVLNIWGAISGTNKSLGLENAAMNFQGISDTISNVICFGVALMFLYIAIDKYKSGKKVGTDKELLLKEEGDKGTFDKKALMGAGLIAVGGLFMLIRKVLLSLEVTNSIGYTGNIGKGFKMDTLPLGLMFGVIGVAIFLVGFGLNINLADQTIKKQSEFISGIRNEPPQANKAEATPGMC
ncbi:hypothetical protein [Candidatus Mesenet endosymbiont of Agriotes lineatus]|uniref:hypothetical protein n=1 Tax=Candidatus Mesenet endosymbiont of Agriotes lineatus TaxID=3077948 RepID=UPI0030CE156E